MSHVRAFRIRLFFVAAYGKQSAADFGHVRIEQLVQTFVLLQIGVGHVVEYNFVILTQLVQRSRHFGRTDIHRFYLVLRQQCFYFGRFAGKALDDEYFVKLVEQHVGIQLVVLSCRFVCIGSKREVESVQTFADKFMFDFHHLRTGLDFRHRFGSDFAVVGQCDFCRDCFCRRVCNGQFERKLFFFRHVVVGRFAGNDGKYVVFAVVMAKANCVYLDAFRHDVAHCRHSVAVRFKTIADDNYLRRLFVAEQSRRITDCGRHVCGFAIRLLRFRLIRVQHRADVV